MVSAAVTSDSVNLPVNSPTSAELDRIHQLLWFLLPSTIIPKPAALHTFPRMLLSCAEVLKMKTLISPLKEK